MTGSNKNTIEYQVKPSRRMKTCDRRHENNTTSTIRSGGSTDHKPKMPFTLKAQNIKNFFWGASIQTKQILSIQSVCHEKP